MKSLPPRASPTNPSINKVRQQYALSQSLYARRSALTSRIPGFWALVFEQAPADIDHFIKPFDMQIFADALLSFSVDRFEINAQPRSFSLRFEFDADKNAYFSDVVLEKKFYLRRSRDGWSGLVSEPVPIHWHDGKDPTDGMMDAAVAFWRKQAEHGQWDAAKLKGTPEFADVVKKAEDPAAVLSTFFTLFAFVANKRYVTAEESAEAEASEAERRSRRAKGEKVEDPEDEPLSLEATDVMVCPHGDDLATALAEDLWPNAIKYFSKLLLPCFPCCRRSTTFLCKCIPSTYLCRYPPG